MPRSQCLRQRLGDRNRSEEIPFLHRDACAVAVSGAFVLPEAASGAAGGPAACLSRAASGRNRLVGGAVAPVSRGRCEWCRSGGDGGQRRQGTSVGAGVRGGRARPAPDRGALLGPGAGRGGVLSRQLDAYPRQAPPGACEGDPETVSRHGEGTMTPRRSRHTRAEMRSCNP